MADYTPIQITYPQHYAVAGTDKDYVGIVQLNHDNTLNFIGADFTKLNFQVHPRVDPTTRPLIIDLADLSNGLSLQMEYFTSDSVSGGVAQIYYTIKTVDTRHREEISSFEYQDGNISSTYNSSFSGTIAVDIPLGDIGQLPYCPVYYYPSYTIYTEGYVGENAARVMPLGCFIGTQNVAMYPMDKLTGEVEWSTYRHYPRTFITNGEFTTEEGRLNLQDGIINAGNGADPFIDPTNPSDKPFENDPSHGGGGYGGFTPNGDVTGKPSLPSSGLLSSGFIAMYNPSLSDLQSLGSALWSDDFVQDFLKLWNDPMEAIISLGLVPFSPPSTGSTMCKIGNYDTQIPMPRVTSQYITLSCGSVSIAEYWGNALDYGPYTEAEIYLPFVGMRKLDIDDIMNKTVSVDYNIDLMGGEAIAYITVDDRVLYDFKCNVQTSIPLSGSSYASLYSGILKGVSGAAIAAAAGGVTGAAAGALTSAVNVITSKHSNIERGGESSPNAGALGILTPYILLHRPVQSLPSNFGHFKGYPSNITRTLSGVSGYTEVEYIHLDGISATDAEKEEIYTLLKAGVIL